MIDQINATLVTRDIDDGVSRSDTDCRNQDISKKLIWNGTSNKTEHAALPKVISSYSKIPNDHLRK